MNLKISSALALLLCLSCFQPAALAQAITPEPATVPGAPKPAAAVPNPDTAATNSSVSASAAAAVSATDPGASQTVPSAIVGAPNMAPQGIYAQPAQQGQLTGSVQAVQQAQTMGPAAADYLDIQYTPGEAKYKFKQYALAFNNKQGRHIEMLQLEVLNGLTEEAYIQAQTAEQQKAQAKRHMAGGLLRGLTGVATSFIPYAGVGSYAAYQAIGMGTSAAYGAANLIQSTPTGSGPVNYSGRILQRAGNIIIGPNQQFQCLAVVSDKDTPKVRVTFRDLQTNQIFDLQK